MGRIIFKISRFLVKVLQIKRWKRASPLLHLTGASSRASKQMDMASWAGSEGESAPFLVRGCNQFCPSPVNLKGADLPRPGSPEQTKKQNWRAKSDRDGWETKESWAVLADQGGNVGKKRVNLKQRKNLDMGSSLDGAELGYGYGYGYRLSTSSVGSSFEGCSGAWERENYSFSSEDPFQESREEFVVPFLKQKSEKRNLAAKSRSRNRGFASNPAVWNQMVDSEEMGSSSSSRSARWSQDFGDDCPFSFPRSSANLVDSCEQYKMLESMSKSWKGSAGAGEPECNKFSAPEEQIHHRKGARKEKLNSDGFSRFKKEAMAEKKMSNNCPCHGQTETEDLFYSGEEKTSDLRPDLSQSRVIKESFPEVRYSYNPYEDFRESMVEMIVEKELGQDGELRDLLLCFLSLNSPKYQNLIIAAFADAIAELSSLPKGMMT